MSMEHPGDQTPRCECCGEPLGPEHIRTREALEGLRNQLATLTYDLDKARERDTEIRGILGLLKRARESRNGYMGAQALERLEQLA